MKLKPSKIDYYFTYVCNTCGCTWEVTQDEVNKVGSIICFGCDAHIIFEPFKLEVHIEYGNLKQDTVAKSTNIAADIDKDAVEALVSLGYVKKYAEENVLLVMSQTAGLSTGDIIMRVCQKDKK